MHRALVCDRQLGGGCCPSDRSGLGGGKTLRHPDDNAAMQQLQSWTVAKIRNRHPKRPGNPFTGFVLSAPAFCLARIGVTSCHRLQEHLRVRFWRARLAPSLVIQRLIVRIAQTLSRSSKLLTPHRPSVVDRIGAAKVKCRKVGPVGPKLRFWPARRTGDERGRQIESDGSPWSVSGDRRSFWTPSDHGAFAALVIPAAIRLVAIDIFPALEDVFGFRGLDASSSSVF